MTGEAPEPAAASASPDRLEELERALDYTFVDRALFTTALTHSSYAHERGDCASNERLEFLGDSVLGMVVANLLYAAHPDWPEGDLTRALSHLVDGQALAALSRRFDIGPCLRLGQTEQRSGGSEKASILEDAMEAVLGAMYLDGGLAPVERLARRVYAEALAPGAPRVARDPKTSFQEWVTAEFGVFPTYELLLDSEVDGDEARFTVAVRVGDETWGQGVARSKRLAERAAAAEANAARAGKGGPDG